MKLKMNLFAGLVNSVWSALVGLAVIPFYLKYLGIEAYGLIGFFATTQAILSLLDMGMAPTINREVARYSVTGNLSEVGTLLHTLAIVYWSVAGVIVLLLALLAPWIAEHWLESKQITTQTITHAVMLMGVVIACRWPVGLYQGALIGAQRLAVSSTIGIGITTIGSLGSVAILTLVSPTIEAFFIWQAIIGIIYASITRNVAWKIIGKDITHCFDIDKLKHVWRFTAGMSGISLTALVFTQLDKVLLSKILGLEDFGHYMLATVVVSGLYVFVNPVFNVIYPRFSALVMTSDEIALTALYHSGTYMLATILFPIAMVLVVFAQDLMFAWTGNMNTATHVAPIISLLAIGSAMHGVMYIPYALQLAYGKTNLPLAINGILMIVLIPLSIFLTLKYGVLGGAMAWLVLHILYIFLGSWLTHCALLKGGLSKWLLFNLGIPFIFSVLGGVIGDNYIQNSGYSISVRLIYGGMLAFLTAILSALMSPQIRIIILTRIQKKQSEHISN